MPSTHPANWRTTLGLALLASCSHAVSQPLQQVVTVELAHQSVPAGSSQFVRIEGQYLQAGWNFEGWAEDLEQKLQQDDCAALRPAQYLRRHQRKTAICPSGFQCVPFATLGSGLDNSLYRTTDAGCRAIATDVVGNQDNFWLDGTTNEPIQKYAALRPFKRQDE